MGLSTLQKKESLDEIEANEYLQSWTNYNFSYRLDKSSVVEDSTQPELNQPPVKAESENVLPMKITVNRQNLISKIQAFVDAEEAKHLEATEAYNLALQPIRELVEANKPGIAKVHGLELVGGSKLMAVAASIASALGVSNVQPVLPASVDAAQKQIQTLSLAVDPELELEDNSPYLQYTK